MFHEAGYDRALGKRAATDVRFYIGMHWADGRALWHRPVLAFARRWGAVGITLGTDVYLLNDSDRADWPLLVHECVHVAQFIERGTMSIVAGYPMEYMRNRAKGQKDMRAYTNIQIEVEARRVEAGARKHLRPKDPMLEAA